MQIERHFFFRPRQNRTRRGESHRQFFIWKAHWQGSLWLRNLMNRNVGPISRLFFTQQRFQLNFFRLSPLSLPNSISWINDCVCMVAAMGCRRDQSGNLWYGSVRTRGLCAVFVHAGKKLKIPFTRRAKSHEIMIMLFRGEHMGNSSAAATATSWFMFNFSISPLFLCALRSFLYLLTCGFGYFLRNKPNKSLEIFLVLTSRLVFSPLFFSRLNLWRTNLLMEALEMFITPKQSRCGRH